jgi:hypothetical protein
VRFSRLSKGLAFLAWIVDHLDTPLIEPSWLIEGRGYQHFLPWEKKRLAHAARHTVM